MVASSADEAVNNAKSYSVCAPGYCLKYVRTWLEIGSRYPSAISAWLEASKKHSGDRNPPRGVPMFYQGGRYGHIVMSLGNRESDNKQMMRTTDVPRGVVSSQPLDYCETYWGYKYLGWAEDLNGILIPYAGKVETPWQSHGKVYVNKLKKGQKDSDSVSRLRYRLEEHKSIPKGKKPGLGNDYGEAVVEAVKWWQKNILEIETAKGENMNNKQANQLFGEAYKVIEE